MNITVCIKFINNEINPFDACALECALQTPGARVTVLSMAPPGAKKFLEALTRLGAERAVLLTDKAFAGADTLATAYALSLAVQRLSPDLVLCGRQSIDGDTAQVGPSLAALLGFRLIANVTKYGTERCGTREGEEAVRLPALMTIERINTLRFPSLRSGITPAEVWDAVAIGADKSRCGAAGSPTRVLQTFENKAGKRSCTFIPPDGLLPLIDQMRTAPPAALPQAHFGEKLDNVWVVGDGLEALSERIAETVTVLPRRPAEEIVRMAKEQEPKAILWPADHWGRKTAPQAAALLRTGLCADCTGLAVEGGRLMMYRPARAGSMMGKILCRTLPQMATVRGDAAREASDVVVSCGRGAAHKLAELRKFAEEIGAAFGVSRPVVDMGLARYEEQIGLTGRSVAPRVYVAVGISGAVQHTCAIEGAGTVIAVNPDKNARIFEYADYGIVSPWI